MTRRKVPRGDVRRAPLLVLLLLFAVTFRGLLFRLDEGFIGRYYVDAWGTQWFYWFAELTVKRDTLLDGALFFYPWGKDVYSHTGGNVLDAILAVPLRELLGQVLGYNTFIFLVFGTNIWGMRRLCGELGAGSFAAWLAGVLFAFNPFLLTEIRDGRPTQAVMVFALLFWQYWLRAGRGWKPTVLAGLFLALTGITYWYYAILAAPAGLALALFDRGQGAFKARILAGVVAGVCVAPLALGMLTQEEVPGLFDTTLWSATTWSPMTVDGMPVGILAFDPLRRMSGFWIEDHDGTRLFTPEWVSVLYIQAGLALAGLWFATPRVRRIGLCILLPSLLISLGPEWMGVPNVPYLLAVKLVRVLQRLWWPARALVFVHIGLTILSIGLWERLAEWPRSRAVASLMVAVAWLADLKVATLAPMPAWSSAIPKVYECLAKDPERAPVFELPYAYTQAHLYYQTVHKHPIFGGMIEDNKIFTPEKQQVMRLENTFIKGLIDLADAKNTSRVISDEDKAAVGKLGYRWVVFDKMPYRNPPAFPEARPRTHYSEVRAALEANLGFPVFEDDSGAIWAPWGGRSPCGTATGEKPNRRSLKRRERTDATNP